jgi:hypothetical protein
MIKEIFRLKQQNLDKINLYILKHKMMEAEFDQNIIQELMTVFEKRINNYGEAEFKNWIKNLHFKIPEEFQDEKEAIQLYYRNSFWLEKEVNKLENETRLSWEDQTEDIKDLDIKARKAQLVIRHRISELVLDL